MTQELENSEQLIPISWAENGEGSACKERWSSEGEADHLEILLVQINTAYKGNLYVTMMSLAHESFHALAALHGFKENSRYEECYAQSYQAAALINLAWLHYGYEAAKWAHGFIQNQPFSDFSLWMSDAYVDNYLRADFWEKYRNYKNLNMYPQGGSLEYNPMKQLAYDFYPHTN